MSTFDLNNYEIGFARDGVKQYVQVSAAMKVEADDRFEGWVYIPASKPSVVSRRAKAKPARWQYRIYTVRGIGLTFFPDEVENGEAVKRAYVDVEIGETVEA